MDFPDKGYLGKWRLTLYKITNYESLQDSSTTFRLLMRNFVICCDLILFSWGWTRARYLRLELIPLDLVWCENIQQLLWWKLENIRNKYFCRGRNIVNSGKDGGGGWLEEKLLSQLVRKGPYCVEDIGENYTHSTQFLWTFKQKWTLRKNTHSAHFIVVVAFPPTFSCTHTFAQLSILYHRIVTSIRDHCNILALDRRNKVVSFG